MTPFKLWQRWDPRLGPAPIRAALRTKRWAIEVVPDIFATGNETLREKVVLTIDKMKDPHVGRWILRTAHPGEAVAMLRDMNDRQYGDNRRKVPARVVLAVYAETQAELDARVAELRAPRVLAENLALTDMEAAIALARKERAIHKCHDEELAAALAAGPEGLSAFLKEQYRYRDRSKCIGPDSGGLALYLSPREPLDVSAVLAQPEWRKTGFRTIRFDVDDRPFDWLIAAGPIGPMGKDVEQGPWPIHPRWITSLAVAAREVEVPFCVPYLGEWACYDHRSWDGDHTVSAGMSSSDAMPGLYTREVDYDPTWKWGDRGWDVDNISAKPSSAYMQAVGSQLVGRALLGRMFDEWPMWHRR
jgi:hypothetical protein